VATVAALTAVEKVPATQRVQSGAVRGDQDPGVHAVQMEAAVCE